MPGTNIYGELIRAQFQLLATPPTPAVTGLVYYHTGSGAKGPKVYDGANWVSAGGGGWYVAPTVTMTEGGSFAVVAANNLFYVSGGTLPVTTSATPFGVAAPALDGTVVRLVGGSSEFTVTLPYSDIDYGVILNGDVVLGKGSVIELQYVDGLKRWIEVSRNMIGGI